MNGSRFIGFLFLLAIPSFAAQPDLCAAPSSTADVKLSLALKDGQSVFQQGEIIPLILESTRRPRDPTGPMFGATTAAGGFQLSSIVSSPRLLIRSRLISALADSWVAGSDPSQLSETPFKADAELNEWRSLSPGHYRLYVVSYRVWRPPDPGEKTSWGRIDATVRSNTVEFDVRLASPQWQKEQLEAALQTLSSSATNDEKTPRGTNPPFSRFPKPPLKRWHSSFGV